MVQPALTAAERLKAEGIEATVINARFVKPLDADTIKRLANKFDLIVTVEEAYLAAGFGSAVMELLETSGLQDSVTVVRMGVDDEIVPHGDPKKLLAEYGLDGDGIYLTVRGALGTEAQRPATKNRLRAVK